MDKSILEHARHPPILSLQKMSHIRIMTVVCNNRNLINLITACNFKKGLPFRLKVRAGKDWKAVLAMADHLVSHLCNCVILKEGLLEWLWPISYRIMLWKSIYAPFVSNTFLQRFYWTNRGRIDNAKTIRYIIRNKNISNKNRFVLACSVCLEKEILEIWSEMSNDDKAYFREEYRETFFPLLLFWINTIEGSYDIVERYMDAALEFAVEEGLLEAIKYLFSISSTNAKDDMSDVCLWVLSDKLKEEGFLEEDEIDIGYVMFFGLSDRNQVAIFNFYSVIVLSLLLCPSEDKLFLNLFTERLHSMSDNNIELLLHMIFYNYHLEVIKESNYRKLFNDVWRMIPTSIRNAFRQRYDGPEFLCVLIKDNFPFLLRKGAFKKIAELNSLDLKPCTSVMPYDFHRDKWEFLHFLVQEEIATISNLKNHRNDILRVLNLRRFNKTTWNAILRFVRKVRSKTPQQKE